MNKTTLLFLLLLLGGCAATGPTRNDVVTDVQNRSGFTLPKQTEAGKITLPPGASLEDELTEDEAVSIALWNNAAFQETLVNLDVAHGDLVQAGLLPNPIGSYTFATPDKPYKYALELPLEVLWLRPFRVKAAQAEAEKVSHQLSQAGLNLIRDTRKAYSDLLQAKAQNALLEESLKLRHNISGLAQKRFKAGDISLQESNAASLDAMATEQAATVSRHDIQMKEERLRFQMGTGSQAGALNLTALPEPVCKEMNINALVEEGLKNRPDALAAHQATIAAGARSNLSLFNWLGISGVVDATSGKKTGHELSPAVKGAIPILNVNQGNIARASAEEERSLRGEHTVADQIRLDINQSYLQYRQACAELGIVQSAIKSGVEKDLERVEKAYASGNVPYLMVLQTTRSVVDARLREVTLIGDAHRASSELERSVGTKTNNMMNGL